MMTETNCNSTQTVLVYNEQTYSYEVFNETGTMGENPSDTFTITLPSERKVEKILEFQEGLSSEDRQHIYLLVKDYVLTHPNKEDRHKFLNRIIKKGLDITIKGPYLQCKHVNLILVMKYYHIPHTAGSALPLFFKLC